MLGKARDHLHLLAEAQDRRALSRGLQGLSIRVAKAVNRRLGRRGSVFADRYHSRALKTPREARLALRDVLLNAKNHERDGSRIAAGFVDGRSSAPWFDGWSRPREIAFVQGAAASESEAPVVAPRTRLLRVGFKRAGPLDPDDAPAIGNG